MKVHVLRRGKQILRAYKNGELAKGVAVKLSRSDSNMAIEPGKRPIFNITTTILK